jgi:hypothetical protein
MAFLFQRYTSTIKGSERESDGTAAFTQLSSPAEPRGTDVGHRHPLGGGRRGSDWWPFHLGRHTQRSANKLIRDNLALLQTQLRAAIALDLDRMLSLLKASNSHSGNTSRRRPYALVFCRDGSPAALEFIVRRCLRKAVSP